MNGAQLHQFLLLNPHKSAREIVAVFGGKIYHINRQCARYAFIYISGWVKETHPQNGVEWVPRYSAIQKPKNVRHPEEK